MDERAANVLTVHRGGAAIYDIVLTRSFDRLAEEIGKFDLQKRKICIVTDSVVADLYLEEVTAILSSCCKTVTSFIFPAGEAYKTLDTVRQLYERLILDHFDRADWLVALGGGVTGDLCGYAAATYLRGVSYVQIPTTLLSQVDSSIGGKTGVDFDSYKNMVGAFHMPRLVYTNVGTLRTLSEEQYSSGMGEIIKHGLIKDSGYYAWLNGNRGMIRGRDTDTCLEMIRVSNEIKREVVEEDPTEQGPRALLNFGHTLGHAIEKLSDFRLAHGHCVGLGILAAARISAERGNLTPEQTEQIRDTLTAFGLPDHIGGIGAEAVLNAARSDKKMDGDRIRFILLRQIGDAYVDQTVTWDEMRTGLAEVLRP